MLWNSSMNNFIGINKLKLLQCENKSHIINEFNYSEAKRLSWTIWLIREHQIWCAYWKIGCIPTETRGHPWWHCHAMNFKIILSRVWLIQLATEYFLTSPTYTIVHSCISTAIHCLLSLPTLTATVGSWSHKISTPPSPNSLHKAPVLFLKASVSSLWHIHTHITQHSAVQQLLHTSQLTRLLSTSSTPLFPLTAKIINFFPL